MYVCKDEKKSIKFMQRTVFEIKVFITNVHELELTNIYRLTEARAGSREVLNG